MPDEPPRLFLSYGVRDTWDIAERLHRDLAARGYKIWQHQAAERKPWPWVRPLKPSLTAPGGSLIRTLEGLTDSVSAVAVTPDGRRALSASGNRTLRLWDLGTGQTIRPLEGPPGLGLGVVGRSRWPP